MHNIYQCKLCGCEKSKEIVSGIKDWEYGFDGVFSYQQCLDCSSIQIHPFPGIDDLVEAYKVDYHGYHESEKKGFIFSFLYKIKDWLFKREIEKIVDLNSRILDIGCGVGELLSRLKAMGILNVEGIDFSEKAIKRLEEKGIKGYLGAFTEFQKEDNFYDLITMNNYLEHTFNPLEELKKTYKLLKKGGYLIGEIPGFDSFERMLFQEYWGGNHVPQHTFQFNEKFLRNLLEEVDFNDIKITHEMNTGHWALSVQNFFQRKKSDLKNNKSLINGRASYYVSLLMAFIPINIFCVLFKKAGVIKFYARG